MSLTSEVQERRHRRRQPEPQRKEIFAALVDAQNHDLNVVQSRKLVMERFGLSERQLRQIEREGVENEWAPL